MVQARCTEPRALTEVGFEFREFSGGERALRGIVWMIAYECGALLPIFLLSIRQAELQILHGADAVGGDLAFIEHGWRAAGA